MQGDRPFLLGHVTRKGLHHELIFVRKQLLLAASGLALRRRVPGPQRCGPGSRWWGRGDGIAGRTVALELPRLAASRPSSVGDEGRRLTASTAAFAVEAVWLTV